MDDTIKKLQSIINESKTIVFFGGAGVSTESGIKDFRGKDGLYKSLYKGYPPEYLLSKDCLEENTEMFYDYYREYLNNESIEPNITHYFLTKLEKSGKLKAIVTQNIDGLHEKSGSKNVLNIHGTVLRNYCNKCFKEYPSDYIFKSSGIPKCECGGLIRPDVVLYGEMLNESFEEAIKYIQECDTLIVGGTSLSVYPAASLVRYFNGKHLVIINDMVTPYDNNADLVIHSSLGEVFSKIKI
jgi:NAD-dependent deacetylase